MTWDLLEPVLLREGLGRDTPQLLATLRAAVDAPDRAARRRALATAARLGSAGQAALLLRALAGSDEPAARELALELVARMPRTESPLLAWLRPLLRDRRLGRRIRLAAAARLFRAGSTADASRVLRDFAAGYGTTRFAARRSTLRKRFAGRRRLFDQLADRLPLACPRCRTKLPPRSMARHLWERHHRLLVGGRVVRPWRLIERWVAGAGREHAHRQLLRLGGRDPGSVAVLRRDAASRRLALCPHCFNLVPLNMATAISSDDLSPLIISGGRVARFGFIAELRRQMFGLYLHVRTPAGVVFDGPEPGASTSWRESSRILVPAAAVLFAAALPPKWVLLGTLLALLGSAGLAFWLRRAGGLASQTHRLVDHAWRMLVPQLHATGFEPADADFAAGLAVTSAARGDARIRERALARLVARTRDAVQAGRGRAKHLVALRRLVVVDADATDGDAVRALADAVAEWLIESGSSTATEALLDDELVAGWSKGRRARLRVLLVAKAFAAGYGVWDLHSLGRMMPGLGRILDSEDTDGLARLRTLWDARPARPWQRRCGPAATVFELANYPSLGGQHLETAPDLLLFQPIPGGGEPLQLLACGRGLVIGGTLLHDWPVAVDYVPLPVSKGGGYELRFAGNAVQIHGDPVEVIRRIKEWGAYLFEEFLPWIGNALTRTGDDHADPASRLTVACPECGARCLARPGGGEPPG